MRVEHLTFTRFVAAMAVVLFHLTVNSRQYASSAGRLLVIGDGAVSYFFVLSGFILVVSNVRDGQLPNRISAVPFWRNRFARIYPLYVVAFVAAALLGPMMSHTGPADSIQAGPFVATLLLVQAWFPPYATYINYPGWSLSVEALFYLLFPVLFPMLVRQRVRVIALTAGVVWVVSLGIHVAMVDAGAGHGLTLYFPLFHLNTFLIGVASGILFVRHQTWLANHTRWLTGAVVIMVPVVTWVAISDNPVVRYYHNGLFAPYFGLLTVWMALQSNRITRWLSGPLPVWLGEISYGIYLLQVPVGTALFILNQSVLHWPVRLYVPAYIALLCCVSALCYRVIEQPARRVIRQWITPAPASTAADERFHHLT